MHLAVILTAIAGHQVYGQSIEELGRLSIEQLANIDVTSVTKSPEPLSRAAAAVFVITANDIIRSGATNLPEVLRLAPNLEVARINAYNWAITARGFNSPESENKLLVLVDGRSVYSPLADTVDWEAFDVPLDNIERIEVISGPGGTLYGANAVNGVINIITKPSSTTQGGLQDVGGGNQDRQDTLRYGGRLGDNATYRVYGLALTAPVPRPITMPKSRATRTTAANPASASTAMPVSMPTRSRAISTTTSSSAMAGSSGAAT